MSEFGFVPVTSDVFGDRNGAPAREAMARYAAIRGLHVDRSQGAFRIESDIFGRPLPSLDPVADAEGSITL